MKKGILFLIVGIVTVTLTGCGASQAFRRGESYAKSGDWDLAVREYRDANKRDPHNIEYRSALLRAEETAAQQHYRRARNFLDERKLEQAIVELQQALYLNPSNAAIQRSLKSVLDLRQAEEHYRASLKFEELGRLSEAINELNNALELDPENVKYKDSLAKFQKMKAETEPDDALTLVSDKPITLNFKNTNIKEVFELMSKLSGINIMFDDEVKAQPVTIFVKDVSFQQALNLLLSANKLFMKQVSADTIIIIPKTKAKMDQYQDLKVKTFYINNAKAKEIVNVLNSMLEIKKVFVNENQNSITVRETPEKIKLIEKIITANDLKEAEVSLDVEILEIDRTNTLQYGWNFSPSLTVTGTLVPTGTTPGTSTSGILLSQLRSLSGDNIVLTIPSVVLNLIKQDADAKTLANPRVRVMNNKQAKFLIGDRIPIQTSTVQSTLAANTVMSTFDYKDTGIKVTAEPTIHLNNTVTLKLGLEISKLGDALTFGNGQTQYTFSTRDADTTVILRDGETVIIGGLIGDDERKSHVKIPLLGDVPVLGKLFSSTYNQTVKTDILMSITPNIVRPVEIPDKDVQSFWSGTEEGYDTHPLFVTTGKKSSKPADKDSGKIAVLESMANKEVPGAPAVGEPVKTEKAEKSVSTAPLLAVSASTLQLMPADALVPVGQEGKLELSAENVRNLYGAIITLSYDPKVVEFKTASEGTFLKKDGQQTSFLFSNNIRAGFVDIYMTRIGNVGGVDGLGSLCAVVFQGKSGGMSDIAIRSVKLMNFAREQLNADVKNAIIRVQ